MRSLYEVVTERSLAAGFWRGVISCGDYLSKNHVMKNHRGDR
jgi:hypothetical protein